MYIWWTVQYWYVRETISLTYQYWAYLRSENLHSQAITCTYWSPVPFKSHTLQGLDFSEEPSSWLKGWCCQMLSNNSCLNFPQTDGIVGKDHIYQGSLLLSWKKLLPTSSRWPTFGSANLIWQILIHNHPLLWKTTLKTKWKFIFHILHWAQGTLPVFPPNRCNCITFCCPVLSKSLCARAWTKVAQISSKTICLCCLLFLVQIQIQGILWSDDEVIWVLS